MGAGRDEDTKLNKIFVSSRTSQSNEKVGIINIS